MHPIRLRGARTHCLKGIDVDLFPGQLVAVTGVSGAGKSSLAFDTLYSEGQRRFVESFSPYARQFLERLERPPMTALDPVAAGVAVDRRAPVKSSRSTVATMADLEAYLSALFVREARPHCPDCDRDAEYSHPSGVAASVAEAHAGARTVVSYPVRVEGTEHFLGIRENLLGDGYRRLFVAGEIRDLDDVRPSEAVGIGSEIDVVVDRLTLAKKAKKRIGAALEEAWGRSGGRARLHLYEGASYDRWVPVVRGLSCGGCGRKFASPRSGLFSYQSPVGACPACRGFGRTLGIDWDKVLPDHSLSLKAGVIRPWTGKKATWERRMLRKMCEERGVPMDRPWADLSAKHKEHVIEGSGVWRRREYPGVRAWFRWLETKNYKMHVRVLLARYRAYDMCSSCQGKRLGEGSLLYRVDGLDLGDWHALELKDARARLQALTTEPGQGSIARHELVTRLKYLERVGLSYLTLNRQARTLSGGEAQRVSLTAALGTSLTGALFVLDEPTVGLHPSDLPPLVATMRELANRGNVVVVVEHDPAVIREADRVVELGPGAGPEGGAIVFDGSPAMVGGREDLATGRALAARAMPAARSRSKRPPIQLRGVRANNLTDLNVAIPCGAVVAVCGPSGSGKSTLVDQVLYRALARRCGAHDVDAPKPHDGIDGAEWVKTVTLVDQSPLGRTSRGNPATYSGAWSRVRALFAAQPEAVMRQMGPGHFSFNVAAGRCPTCNGEGAETVEMQFLADVRLSCPVCKGKRFREEVLEVKLHGRSISDVLDMSVQEALAQFDLDKAITRALRPLAQLGLAYLKLGQGLPTLSGGEAQRLKLARALKQANDESLFVLDEPSAGLHADEVELLNSALRQLVEAGASVVVVDHDLGVISAADHVIELGPGGGMNGGRVLAELTPRQLARRATRTGRALAAAVRGEACREVPSGQAREVAASALTSQTIEVVGAREHNLKNVRATIPHGKLVVVTGPSGSGKSSLAFDVVFAEGQRRFLETLTPYARQFLPTMPRPEMDRVTGVPPAVALEQRTSRAGVNSTVATVTEIAHYMRLLFAKLGDQHCPECDQVVSTVSSDQLYGMLKSQSKKRVLRAPVVRARKGSYLDVFTAADRAGIQWAWCDGKVVSTDKPPRLNKRKEHTIELIVYEGPLKKLKRSVFEQALGLGKGQLVLARAEGEEGELLSTTRACTDCAVSLPELDPRWFSFNTNQGRCGRCEGTGYKGGVGAVHEAARVANGFDRLKPCVSCGGSRLAPIPRSVRLFGDRYHEHMARSVGVMRACAEKFSFAGDQAKIAEAPLAELLRRLRFVEEVGLDYLGLDRPARTLSGGEMQRLRLAAQLGSGLTGALYVLDEPTIGLHPRDTGRLLSNLRALVDTGSTVLVVEHDADTIRAADHLIDLGPSGGRGGGRVMAAGPAREVLACADSPTGQALADEQIMSEARKRLASASDVMVLQGVSANNLDIDALNIPVGRMCVVAGVSGSGKSTLISQVLYPAVRKALGLVAPRAGKHQSLSLPPQIARAMAVDQSPIGRTSRSIPATFLGIWDLIRRLFAGMPEARVRGYKATRFSFNSAQGGRCTACDGKGVIAHEMALLPDVKTVCDACVGMRFDEPTLDIRYLGLSIGDVLRLTVSEAVEVFAAHPKIVAPLKMLCDLGIGYVKLGQGSPTLSGGEAQRLKLASELTAGRMHKPTLYVLDEPTTGLHHSDVARLIRVLDRLVERGDSLVIIEHHPAVIAAADHIIELGPEGGERGGRVVIEGTPEVVATANTATGLVLRSLFGSQAA